MRESREKLASLPEAVQVLKEAAPGKKVVFTNGCFDMLHPGHVNCLEQARRLGEFLIVGVNSDRSVRRLKGPGRPALPVAARARMVAALGCVDMVIIYDDSTPVPLIEALQPDIHVKGADYVSKPMPERETVESYGGRVVLVSLEDGWSTSEILSNLNGAS
jgi:D-beta-D-heptose 7-phosphate kinase/D-beta-D-heptose 1-phosphate adenosyltransferase